MSETERKDRESKPGLISVANLGATSKSKHKLLVSKANTEGFKLYSDTKEEGGFKRRFKVLRQI